MVIIIVSAICLYGGFHEWCIRLWRMCLQMTGDKLLTYVIWQTIPPQIGYGDHRYFVLFTNRWGFFTPDIYIILRENYIKVVCCWILLSEPQTDQLFITIHKRSHFVAIITNSSLETSMLINQTYKTFFRQKLWFPSLGLKLETYLYDLARLNVFSINNLIYYIQSPILLSTFILFKRVYFCDKKINSSLRNFLFWIIYT